MQQPIPVTTNDLGELEPKDLGEAGQQLDNVQAEVAPDTEKQKRIQAGFKLLDDARTLAIQHDVVSQSDADNFRLLDDSPKGGDIKKAYEDTTQELADKGDDPEEVIRLKEAQAKLYLEYAYNTLALLQDYKHEMYNLVFKAAARYRDSKTSSETGQDSSDNSTSLDSALDQLLQMGVKIESIEKNATVLVPEIIGEYPQLVGNCVELNANFLTYQGQSNQLKDAPDQAPKELGRFYDSLKAVISVDRINRIKAWIDSTSSKPSDASYNVLADAAFSEERSDDKSSDATQPAEWSDQTSQTGPNLSQFEESDQTNIPNWQLDDKQEQEAEKVLQDA